VKNCRDLDVLRDFRPDDQTSVREIVLAGMRERWGEAFDPAANVDLDDIWTYYVLERRAEVVVCEKEGAVVATGTLLPVDINTGQLVRIAVIRHQRRKGIAITMVKELARRARQNEMKTLLVTTDPPWTDAVELYRACGFAVFETTTTTTAMCMKLASDAQQ
jgi:N-acetylglutamate synthase-like GNAT family acetyltransferase